MSRKELLDARKALRSFREGVSGPRSKKQRGEWEMASTETMYYHQKNLIFVVLKYENDHIIAGSYSVHTQLSGTAVMEMKTRQYT